MSATTDQQGINSPTAPSQISLELAPLDRPLTRRCLRWDERSVSYLFGAMVAVPVLALPYTWLYFLGMTPAGQGLTGCLLEQYCHVTPSDVIHSQLLGLIGPALSLSILLVLAIARKPAAKLAGLATLLGGVQFIGPIAIWLAWLNLGSPTPFRTIVSYCATETSCQYQPGLSYFFITPIEGVSVLLSLILYVITVTIWLHLRVDRRRSSSIAT